MLGKLSDCVTDITWQPYSERILFRSGQQWAVDEGFRQENCINTQYLKWAGGGKRPQLEAMKECR